MGRSGCASGQQVETVNARSEELVALVDLVGGEEGVGALPEVRRAEATLVVRVGGLRGRGEVAMHAAQTALGGALVRIVAGHLSRRFLWLPGSSGSPLGLLCSVSNSFK